VVPSCGQVQSSFGLIGESPGIYALVVPSCGQVQSSFGLIGESPGIYFKISQGSQGLRNPSHGTFPFFLK